MAGDSALAASRVITGATLSGENQKVAERLRAFLNRQSSLDGTVGAIRIDTGRRSAGASSGTILFDADIAGE